MTELQALHVVRERFPEAEPIVNRFGFVECRQGGKVVAELSLEEGSWYVAWGDEEEKSEAKDDATD